MSTKEDSRRNTVNLCPHDRGVNSGQAFRMTVLQNHACPYPVCVCPYLSQKGRTKLKI